MEKAHVSYCKKKARAVGAAIIFEDEATFRQDASLHATWAKRGCTPQVPTSSSRGSVKVYGCVNIFESRFDYAIEKERFNARTYLAFLKKVIVKQYYPQTVYYVHDNASYHKDKTIMKWFEDNKHWIHLVNSPPYCPELNAAEHIWHYTRVQSIHNQYFDSRDDVEEALRKLFSKIKRTPSHIEG